MALPPIPRFGVLAKFLMQDYNWESSEIATLLGDFLEAMLYFPKGLINMHAIRASGLTKIFTTYRSNPSGPVPFLFRQRAETVAVNNVSFDIAEGEMVGYIGLNGAGKSTTVKILTGILTPTRGGAKVFGIVPYQERERNAYQIGVVFGQRSQLWWDLPLRESFHLLRDLYGLDDETFARNLTQFSEILGLASFLDTPVRHLSLGQRMRGEIAAAFIHNPRVVFLDEPTIGLDFLIKDQLFDSIREINRSWKTTVFLTTHNLHDIEKLCNRVIIIHQGRLIFDGFLDQLLHQFGRYRSLMVHLARDYPDIIVEGTTLIERNGQRVVLEFDRYQYQAPEVVTRLVNRYEVLDLSIKDPTLEMVVKSLLGEAER